MPAFCLSASCNITPNACSAELTHLEEPRAKGRVLVGQQAAGDVRVGHLQKVEPGGQGQADALLSQQRPAEKKLFILIGLRLQHFAVAAGMFMKLSMRGSCSSVRHQFIEG